METYKTSIVVDIGSRSDPPSKELDQQVDAVRITFFAVVASSGVYLACPEFHTGAGPGAEVVED